MAGSAGTAIRVGWDPARGHVRGRGERESGRAGSGGGLEGSPMAGGVRGAVVSLGCCVRRQREIRASRRSDRRGPRSVPAVRRLSAIREGGSAVGRWRLQALGPCSTWNAAPCRQVIRARGGQLLLGVTDAREGAAWTGLVRSATVHGDGRMRCGGVPRGTTLARAPGSRLDGPSIAGSVTTPTFHVEPGKGSAWNGR